jgi:hypothetical protein
MWPYIAKLKKNWNKIKMIKIIVLAFSLIFPLFGFAQESSYLQPGWSGNYKYGLGFSSGYITGTDVFVFDIYTNPDISFTTYFGYYKNEDGFRKTISNNGTTIIETNSGSKVIGTITLAESYNLKVFRNDWINIRVGALFGINYYTKSNYDTGTRSTIIASGAVTDTAYGTVTISEAPQFFAGPILSTALNIRWLPMITVGMDGGIVIHTESKTTTTTKTTSGAVTTTTSAVSRPGLSADTIGNGLFNLRGDFNIRYVW